MSKYPDPLRYPSDVDAYASLPHSTQQSLGMHENDKQVSPCCVTPEPSKLSFRVIISPCRDFTLCLDTCTPEYCLLRGMRRTRFVSLARLLSSKWRRLAKLFLDRSRATRALAVNLRAALPCHVRRSTAQRSRRSTPAASSS